MEHHFPPDNATGVYRVLVALNLLNASVKQAWGKKVTSYAYIKGMASCLFLWLLYNPMEEVQIYWDKKQKIGYFQVCDHQFSFHYLPLVELYQAKMANAGLKRLVWDGIRWQDTADTLFHEAMPLPNPFVEDATKAINENKFSQLKRLMTGFGMKQLRERLELLQGVDISLAESVMRSPSSRTLTDSLPLYGLSQPNMSPHNDNHPPSTTSKRKPHLKAKKDIWFNLLLALTFSGWRTADYELTRPGDYHRARIAHFTGSNYEHVLNIVAGHRPVVWQPPRYKLISGEHYYLRRSNWQWRRVTPSRYLLIIAHYYCLTIGHTRYNLCITYGIACHLASIYPKLRFMNILNYSRFKVHRRLYTYRELLNVPPRSRARKLKVWMVVDRDYLLHDFDITTLPSPLRKEYKKTPDYKYLFQIVHNKGHVGLVAYSWFHLLPEIYLSIRICGHFAHVMDGTRKWAIYSLLEEKFITHFIYDRIWFDNHTYSILATCNGTTCQIHTMPTKEEFQL